MRKTTIIYLAVIVLLIMVVIYLYQAKVIILQNYSAIDLNPSDAITIWAAILTIVFLLFSLLGLLNIDHKIEDLNKIKIEMQDTSIEMREQLSMLRTSTAEEREKIVKSAEVELKKIISESAIRQNLFDELGRIAANPIPDKRAQGYLEVLKSYPNLSGVNYAYIHICRGNAFLAMHLFDKALIEYDEAIRLNPQDATCYNALGYFYVQKKDYLESIKYFQKALEIKPDSETNMMNIGNSYAAMGQYKEAQKYFDRASITNPNLAEVYYNKSLEFFGSNEPINQELQLHYLGHCIDINPLFFKAHINKASILKDQGKLDQAIDECNKVITDGVNEDFVYALIERGCVFLKNNQPAMALLSFQYAYLFKPNNIQILLNLAVCHVNLLELNKGYEFILQAFFESERQKDHENDKELRGLLSLVYDSVKNKPPYGPDNINEYVEARMKSLS